MMRFEKIMPGAEASRFVERVDAEFFRVGLAGPAHDGAPLTMPTRRTPMVELLKRKDVASARVRQENDLVTVVEVWREPPAEA